ncbi:MAG: histidine phosphatase family protein [Acidimicrobiales bacterium]|nr:MAG: histidine phosphatase family protein [Acidimicrobiales bacterium]
MGQRRLLLWRHGQTEWNASQRVQGQSDVGLNEVGRRQAKAATVALAQERPALIVSSDLRRAYDTAQVLAQQLGLPLQVDDRLRERGFGIWQGLDSVQMAEQNPIEFQRWRAGGEPDIDGIESEPAITARVSAAIHAALARTDGTVCLVTHGGVIKRALTLLLNWPASVPWGFEGLGNCRWVQLRTSDGSRWRVHSYNVGVDSPQELHAAPPAVEAELLSRPETL